MTGARTVLAVDELMAAAIAPMLPGEVVRLSVLGARRTPKAVADMLRPALGESPCVLAIGSWAWNAIPALQRLRVLWERPVVLVTPNLTTTRRRQASALNVFSIVPASDADLAQVVAVEVRLAAYWLAGRGRRRPFPVVVLNPKSGAR